MISKFDKTCVCGTTFTKLWFIDNDYALSPRLLGFWGHDNKFILFMECCSREINKIEGFRMAIKHDLIEYEFDYT